MRIEKVSLNYLPKPSPWEAAQAAREKQRAMADEFAASAAELNSALGSALTVFNTGDGASTGAADAATQMRAALNISV